MRPDVDPRILAAQDTVELPLHRLDPRVVWLWRLAAFGGVVTVLAALGVLNRFLLPEPFPTALWIFIGGLGLAGAWAAPPLRYRAWSYQIGRGELRLCRGVLARTTSVIPYVRIQHVDTRQDLVERALGLARVVVFTAGIRGAELVLPGLPSREAERLRDRLAGLAGVEHAV